MRFWATVVTVVLGVGSPACSTASVLGGLNGPCERENDCAPDLSCVGGVCVASSGSAWDGGDVADALAVRDAGQADASPE
jgi:hypothetical protein